MKPTYRHADRAGHAHLCTRRGPAPARGVSGATPAFAAKDGMHTSVKPGLAEGNTATVTLRHGQQDDTAGRTARQDCLRGTSFRDITVGDGIQLHGADDTGSQSRHEMRTSGGSADALRLAVVNRSRHTRCGCRGDDGRVSTARGHEAGPPTRTLSIAPEPCVYVCVCVGGLL